MVQKRHPKIICIAGPTGSGKTSAALHIAYVLASQGLYADILNADSRQVYRDFPIITAQPTLSERSTVSHKLYGWLESDRKISAGEWARLASVSIADTIAQGHIPILVGGTGFYMKALLDGIAAIPHVEEGITASLLEECKAKGTPSLYASLATVDPDYAMKIHKNDKQRIIRALEVWQSTGHTFSWWHKHAMPKVSFNVLRLGVGLSLGELTPFLEARIHAMLDNGAIEEARKAFLRCPDRHAPGWSGIGCMELGAFITGEISLQECIRAWKANTRAYAKRQWTWFKADRRIQWHRPGEFAELEQKVRRFLFSKTSNTDPAINI